MTEVSPDLVRRLGFESVFRLPQTDFAALVLQGARGLDTEAEMARLTPEQRDRVYNVATRRLAFQILYQLDAAAIKGDIAPVLRDELARVSELGPIAAEKCAAFVTGAWANRSQSDADFTGLAPQWPAHRQPGVDRAILRLAHHEISKGITPPRIAINEAVELARAFSTEKSPSFINALLDKVAAKTAPAPAPDAPTAAST